jgi:hypothetical protein
MACGGGEQQLSEDEIEALTAARAASQETATLG